MRIKYLSGPFTGYEETVERVAGEVMCQFGYAEPVLAVEGGPEPESVSGPEPDPALIAEPPLVEPPASGIAAAPGPDPVGGPLFDP